MAVLGTIGCDHVTKQIASNSLAGQPMQSFFFDTVRLRYLENTGAFLSLGSRLPDGARTAVFTVGTGILLLAIAVAAFRYSTRGLAALGLALFVSGGVSNWIDRALNGRVVDFLNVGIGPVRTGVFNVADMAIMFGAALFMYGEFRATPKSQDFRNLGT
jgi:signal peptidase II